MELGVKHLFILVEDSVLNYVYGYRIQESGANLDHFVDVESVGFDHVKIWGKKGITDDAQDPGLSSRLDA